eukprot:gene10347-21586_t
MNLTSARTVIQSLKMRGDKIISDIPPEFIESINDLSIIDWVIVQSQLDFILNESSWEYSALWLLIIRDHLRLKSTKHNDKFLQLSIDHIINLLEHQEARVRTIAAEVVGQLSNQNGITAYETLAPILISRINELFDRTETTRPVALGDVKNIGLDDTTGWKSLETYVIAFKELLQGNNTLLMHTSHMNDNIYELFVTKLSTHINRHIRQACHDVSRCMIEGIIGGLHLPSHHPIISRVLYSLQNGLQDNWSQVRYTASVTARSFLLALSDTDRESTWYILLPRLCMNRFHVADGVKGHTQETWRLVMGDTGRHLVATYIQHVVAYYIEMSHAPNHMVAEAACHAMSELAVKVDRSAVEPFATLLLEALQYCSAEDSWPIRDAACLSSGIFVRYYPLQATPMLDTFFELWTNHLHDPIWSIRDNAAIAVGELLQCIEDNSLRDRAINEFESYITNNIFKVRDELTIDQQRVSQVQFLSPAILSKLLTKKPIATVNSKIKVSRADWGCCLDCVVVRDGRPWEMSDGAVFLLRELAKNHPKLAEKHVPSVWSLLDVGHFKDCHDLHTSVLQQLPIILTAIGKVFVKSHIANHMHTLHRVLHSESEPVVAAAEEFVRIISKLIGPSIFMHRVPNDLKN